MIIIIILVILLVAGIIIYRDEYYGISVCLLIVGGIGLFFSLLLLPVSNFKYHVRFKELEAFEQTINSARADKLTEYERAAITIKISEWNEWIAKTKYYKNSIIGLWIPDKIEEIEFLK